MVVGKQEVDDLGSVGMRDYAAGWDAEVPSSSLTHGKESVVFVFGILVWGSAVQRQSVSCSQERGAHRPCQMEARNYPIQGTRRGGISAKFMILVGSWFPRTTVLTDSQTRPYLDAAMSHDSRH